MNITILNQYFYPDNVTSATLATELALELAKNSNYSVKVVTGYPKEYKMSNEPIDVQEVYSGVKIRRLRYYQPNRASTIGRIVNYFSFFFRLLFSVGEFRNTDWLIVYSSPPLSPIVPAIIKNIYKFKIMYVVHDLYPDIAESLGYITRNGFTYRIFSIINRYVFSKSDKIIVLSSEMKEYFLRTKGFGDRVEVIPNWYTPTIVNSVGDADKKSSHASTNKKDKQPIRIVYGGNLGIPQDVDKLINEIERCKDDKGIVFVFACHGNKKEYFFSKIKEKGISNVIDAGYIGKGEYDRLVEESDMALLSFDPKSAGMASPSKVYAYLAHSKPVIFIGPSTMEIAIDLTAEKSGFVITPDDYFNMLDAIKIIKSNDKIMKEMGENAFQLYSKKYRLSNIVETYIRTLESKS